jgi:hypothetical protein
MRAAKQGVEPVGGEIVVELGGDLLEIVVGGRRKYRLHLRRPDRLRHRRSRG